MIYSEIYIADGDISFARTVFVIISSRYKGICPMKKKRGDMSRNSGLIIVTINPDNYIRHISIAIIAEEQRIVPHSANV